MMEVASTMLKKNTHRHINYPVAPQRTALRYHDQRFPTARSSDQHSSEFISASSATVYRHLKPNMCSKNKRKIHFRNLQVGADVRNNKKANRIIYGS